ncbi:methyl-accepting chemotaxis protein [Brevibacillus massiliensis]|jgi:gas vesicle protein|uniref:methyl-accepting chemotaxis protein n=1 Tax=Brevibacillus massiliensis TaxID=1118054 RepID=UPI0003151796|nr:methyl-accepting chemotaxis protein [Brevibacillus massiliensis]
MDNGLQLFHNLLELAPLLREIFVDDVSIAIQDRERVLRYIPGATIDLGIKDGDLLKAGSVSYQVIQTGKKIMKMVGREVHGVPYIALGYPIFHEGTVIGCITTITSIDKREQMMRMAEQLSASMQQFTASIQSASASSDYLYQHNEVMKSQLFDVESSVQQIDKITKMVVEIAGKINILGLNASIEAARAGEYGRGFSVVASEIRNLAENSSKSTKTISTQLYAIQQAVKQLAESNRVIFESTEVLSRHLKELTQLIGELTDVATVLSEMAQVEQ